MMIGQPYPFPNELPDPLKQGFNNFEGGVVCLGEGGQVDQPLLETCDNMCDYKACQVAVSNTILFTIIF